MSRRLAAIGVVLTVAAPCANAGPARPELLGAPPAHARAGVCYAHVRRGAPDAPPPGPRAFWRLSPPPPGAPGPVWCLVVAERSEPLRLRVEREGWIRVLCAPAHGRGRAPPPPRATFAGPAAAPGYAAQSWRAASIPPVPPPVVRLIPLAPAANYGLPGPHVLNWPGKNGR